MKLVCPSLLSANFADLKSEIKMCEEAGVDMLHLDVMDGHFVPNITIGSVVVESLKKATKIPLDCHLMIENPEKYIESFAKAGANIITIHAEAVIHLERAIKQIKSFGVKAGLSLVPTTHESVLEYILSELDLILIMTVNPGFGGQSFLHSQLPKIEKVRKMIEKSGKEIILQVDGGIDENTSKLTFNAGANAFVAGNFLFKNRDNFKTNVNILKEIY
jgi:ribulose-phosphate 3-epimerase